MLSETTQLQRYLSTEFINKRRLNIPAVWLKPEGLVPSPEDAVADSLSTDLNAWTDQNLGVRLVDGHVELRLTTPDDIWSGCLFEAFRHLHVDARAAFGAHHVTSIIIRIENEDTIDRWEARWPVGHTDKEGQKVSTKVVYSAAPTSRSKAIWRCSAPLPGSIVAGADILWRPMGKPPATEHELGVEDLEMRQLSATSMESVCRGIAYATLLYWIRIYLDGLEDWDMSLTRTIGGWLAKIIPEGQAINAQGKSLEGVCWAPIDSPSTAVDLLTFLQKSAHATNQLGVTFLHAEGQLQRDPGAHVPGWSSLETVLGVQAKMGVRHAFKAGLDIDIIEVMAERYVLDESEHNYLDRESLLQGVHYEHGHDDLVRKWENKPFFVGKKRHNPFRLYASSELRTDVKGREFFPGHEPGAILRFSPTTNSVLPNDSDREADEYRTLNIFPGFKIKPIATIDQAMMTTAVTMLDRMLGLLTRDNDAQIKWLKQFVAWIIQSPEIKPQVCPIIIGGQGIGKSLFGDNLMRALLGNMAGMADAGSLSDNKFLITPFIGKLITFVDEVKLESVAAINQIKKIVRADYVSGQVKFGHQKDWYIPSRMLIASNSPDIGLTPADAADRAFFFIISWTAQNKGMLDNDFLTWSLTLKPFYSEFVQLLKDIVFKQHLMRYFTEFEVTRAELENLQYSSRNDESVVQTMMSKARAMAREIVAEARIYPDLEITAWFTKQALRDAIKRMEGVRGAPKIDTDQVLMEFQNSGVLETMRQGMFRFKYGYRKILEKMGEAHNLEIHPNYDWIPGDNSDNEVRSVNGAKPWRGLDKKNQRDSADPHRPPYNEDDHVD